MSGDRAITASEDWIVDVDGYEGPLDVLLALAREQKVDLKQISIVQLADQYLEFVAEARRANLELAADYLVMAAWLAYLKSRLLLPEPSGADEPSSEVLAAALTFQLRRLDAMREAGVRLMARARLHQDVLLRGRPETFGETAKTVVSISLYDLLKAYGDHLGRRRDAEALRIDASDLWSVEDALEHLRRSLGHAPGWESLACCLPPGTLEGLRQGHLAARSALAATFVAGLELARQGTLKLRQNRPFGPIYVRVAERHIPQT